MKSSHAVLRTITAFGLGALLAGAVHATLVIFPRTWVLEFQAGPPSSAFEKAAAVVQSAAIEGVGFLTLGLAFALVAVALARVLPGLRREDAGSSFGGALLLVAGAFALWSQTSWIAEDALDFLTRPRVVLLDGVACVAILAALAFFELLVRRCSWAPRASEPNVLGSLAGVGLATWVALRILRSGAGGWHDPTQWALAGIGYLFAIPLAAGVARALDRPVRAVRERLRAGPLLPARLVLVGWALFSGCTVWTALHFRLSARGTKPAYTTLPPRPEGPGPNVVFVTVDTLRADHLGCYGYPRPTSPFIDSLAAEGVRCADATAAASWTKPATGTILTGLHPSRHGALYHGSLLHLPEGKQTLAEAFRENGWVTAGFVANPNLKHVFDFDRGFDVYFDSPVEDTPTLACIRGTWFGQLLMKLLRHQFNWNYENDITAMNGEVLAWLEKNSAQRFFLYAHYIDPHIPYDPPARYREEFARDPGFALFNERKRRVGIDLYDGEIRYTDDGIRALVDKLRALGVWDNTLFVFTSDHGEEFFEHGVLGHGFSLYQEVVHVPLILRGPGIPAGGVLEKPVQILDLAASVLDLAGIGSGQFGDGTSFAGNVVERAEPGIEPLFLESEFGQDDSDHRAFVFTGVRKGPWKLVLTEKNEFFPPSNPLYGREALYDLSADPAERRNLFREHEHQDLITGLLDGLRAHAQFLQETGFRDIPPAALSPETEAALKALGYIGGDK